MKLFSVVVAWSTRTCWSPWAFALPTKPIAVAAIIAAPQSRFINVFIFVPSLWLCPRGLVRCCTLACAPALSQEFDAGRRHAYAIADPQSGRRRLLHGGIGAVVVTDSDIPDQRLVLACQFFAAEA